MAVFTLLLLLLCTFVLLELLQLAGNLYLRRKLSFSFTEEGICVVNSSFLPVFLLRIHFVLYNHTTGAKTQLSGDRVLNGKSTTIFSWEDFSWEFCNQSAGFYEITISDVRLFDSFCLLYISSKISLTGIKIKMPSFHAAEIKEWNAQADSESTGEENGAHSEFGDMVSIREYIPGDSLRQMHFKLSAKFDDLYVKEYEAEETQEQILIYETIDGMAATVTEEEIEAKLEDFFSRSLTLVQEGAAHKIIWYDGKRKKLEIHRIDSTDILVESMYLLMRCERSRSDQTTVQIFSVRGGSGKEHTG